MNSVTAQIGGLSEPKLFTLDEAQGLFPLINKLTAASARELAPVKERLDKLVASDPRIGAVEVEYTAIVQRWAQKMNRLGVIVHGLWGIDFDTGEGYFSWRYPELRLGHYYPYDSGFDSRRLLDEVIDEYSPDWA